MKQSNTTSNFTDREGVINYSTDVNYWDEKKGKYRIFSGKDKISIYRDTDLIEAFGNKYDDLGRLFKLINSMDSNNMLGIYDRHLKHYQPVTNKQMLYDMLGLTNHSRAAKFYDRLREIELLKEWHNDDGETVYYINPVYTMADRGITLTVYKLFYKELNRVLPYKARISLQALCSNPAADNSQVVTYDDADNVFVDGVLYDSDKNKIISEPEEEKQAIFNEYILENKPAKTYQIINSGMVAHDMTIDNDTYFLVNEISGYKQTKPANADIIGYRSWYIDIDCGKDSDGQYFSLEEVSARKQQIKTVIDCLPTPTAIIDTRNGYHVYYACFGVDDSAVWQQLEDKLISITKIADPAVRDAARVLRMPGSVWIKSHTGLPPYPVSILAANRQAYDIDSFRQQLDDCASDIQTAADTYIAMYPIAANQQHHNMAAAVPAEHQSRRVQAIIDLSLDTFDVPEPQEVNNVKEYLRQQNMADFLQIANPASFCCILHDDHNPSASIYHNESGYRYYCANAACIGHGDGHGADIIDVVKALSGCKYRHAVNYLTQIYNIKESKNQTAA